MVYYVQLTNEFDNQDNLACAEFTSVEHKLYNRQKYHYLVIYNNNFSFRFVVIQEVTFNLQHIRTEYIGINTE